MALPVFAEARLFYQAAKQRFQDSQFLLEAGRNTAAVYLAGYSVECILKALILSLVAAEQDRKTMLASFRGAKAHDFEWLKRQYLDLGGPPFPADVARRFARVNTWTTDMRYQPGTARRREAEAFLRAAEAILEWADGRL